MTDATDQAPSQAAARQDRRTRRRLLGGAIAAAAIAAAAWLGFALVGPASDSNSPPTTSTEISADPILPPERRYSDQELGIDKLIEEEITPFEAQYRSLAEWEGWYGERQRYLADEAMGHERERIYFERNLEWLLSSEYEELPADLGSGGTLERAFEDAMDRCAEEAGWPGLELNVSSTADVDVELRAFGLTHTEFLDLRHECAKQAASYPTLVPSFRDELLDRLREHYRRAVHEYLREFPDAEVPQIDHEGAPRPLEDRLIRTCQKDPDPPACAEEFRVELPTG